MKISPYTYTEKKGFTLVEVLVSLSLFTIVVTMSVGTLLVLIDANSKQQNMQVVMTNLAFALDSMTREIRTGYFYECRNSSSALQKDDGPVNKDCSNPGGNVSSNFAFTESGDSLTAGKGSSRIAYRLAGTTIERRLGDPDNGGTDWHAITAPEVIVNKLAFIVAGAKPNSIDNNTKSPTVTIFVSGTAGDIAGLDSSFNIQTTVTQQILDI